jgi:hypothetical protein
MTAAQDKPVRVTEPDVIAALRARYGQRFGNGPRYAVATGVRSHAGHSMRRTADFIAMDLWPSRGLALHGHEVKVSRSDWLRELADPGKAAEFIPYVNYWWAVISDPAIVRDGELPDGWGLMAMRGTQLAVIRQAPRRVAEPLYPSRLGGLLRAVAQSAANRERCEHEDAFHCHRRGYCGTPRVRCCCPENAHDAERTTA